MNGRKVALLRRVERRFVDVAMATLAFALERLVVRSIRRQAKGKRSGSAPG